MLFSPEKTQKQGLDSDVQSVMSERPPSYYPPLPTPSGSSFTPTSPVVETPANNYLYLSRDHNSIKSSFVIDPFMEIPTALKPSIGLFETMKNMKLCTNHGKIETDILLVGEKDDTRAKKAGRTTIELASKHGGIAATVRTSSSTPRPFHLKATCTHSNLSLSLPQTFHGLVSIDSSHGAVTFSDALTARAKLFSDNNGSARYFIGDFSGWVDGQWTGDEVVIVAKHAKTKLSFADEVSLRKSAGSKLKKKGIFW